VKIRAITVGINFTSASFARRIKKMGEFIKSARQAFEESGYRVQTTRMTSQPWVEYLSGLSTPKLIDRIRILEDQCHNARIDFLSIGTAHRPEHIKLVAKILDSTKIVSCSATIAEKKKGMDHDATLSAAQAIMRIAQVSGNGEGNFRFAALANCPSDIPFFPASFHRGRSCFMIALESGDLLVKALTAARDLVTAKKKLTSLLESEYKKIEKIAERMEKRHGIFLRGIDTSPAPSIQRSGSVALAIEKMGHGEFGTPGTLAVAGMITSVLRSLRVRKCGFSGLMLPVMEDFGLAQRIGKLSIDALLIYSAICGTGLDCVPLPGDIGVAKIRHILLDVATLALRLNKPLSARLLPIPGQGAGAMTKIDSPYLINCQIPRVR
jgi:uncharacterized protein (UPF0210 family)